MTEKWHGGKGDRPRPISNREQFDVMWTRIFGNPKYSNRIFGKLDNEDTISESKGQETPTMDERPADRTS